MCAHDSRARGEGDTALRKIRARPGEGAFPRAQTPGEAPSPAALRASTSPCTRGEVERAAALGQELLRGSRHGCECKRSFCKTINAALPRAQHPGRKIMRTRLAIVLASLLGLVASAQAQSEPPAKLIGYILLPNVEGWMDHLAVDLKDPAPVRAGRAPEDHRGGRSARRQGDPHHHRVRRRAAQDHLSAGHQRDLGGRRRIGQVLQCRDLRAHQEHPVRPRQELEADPGQRGLRSRDPAVLRHRHGGRQLGDRHRQGLGRDRRHQDRDARRQHQARRHRSLRHRVRRRDAAHVRGDGRHRQGPGHRPREAQHHRHLGHHRRHRAAHGGDRYRPSPAVRRRPGQARPPVQARQDGGDGHRHRQGGGGARHRRRRRRDPVRRGEPDRSTSPAPPAMSTCSSRSTPITTSRSASW